MVKGLINTVCGGSCRRGNPIKLNAVFGNNLRAEFSLFGVATIIEWERETSA